MWHQQISFMFSSFFIFCSLEVIDFNDWSFRNRSVIYGEQLTFSTLLLLLLLLLSISFSLFFSPIPSLALSSLLHSISIVYITLVIFSLTFFLSDVFSFASSLVFLSQISFYIGFWHHLLVFPFCLTVFFISFLLLSEYVLPNLSISICSYVYISFYSYESVC